ncbi:hypothetical protein CCR94_17845 [Rhodoblastus sphagnicola]|uniref:Uncharacterized protein n=1 Tax=Rhodoblastus sphagnicola TaxID=333368 RepID=A0A2S6N1D1_9HYPH|nr:hypothetical protein CCR94_17845 [Rhodoblastus sphagnicola]
MNFAINAPKRPWVRHPGRRIQRGETGSALAHGCYEKPDANFGAHVAKLTQHRLTQGKASET